MPPVKLLMAAASQLLLQGLLHELHATSASTSSDLEVPLRQLQAMAAGEAGDANLDLLIRWLAKAKEGSETTRKLAASAAAMCDEITIMQQSSFQPALHVFEPSYLGVVTIKGASPCWGWLLSTTGSWKGMLSTHHAVVGDHERFNIFRVALPMCLHSATYAWAPGLPRCRRRALCFATPRSRAVTPPPAPETVASAATGRRKNPLRAGRPAEGTCVESSDSEDESQSSDKSYETDESETGDETEEYGLEEDADEAEWDSEEEDTEEEEQ